MRSIAGSIVILAGAFLFAFGAASAEREAAVVIAVMLMLFGVAIMLVDLFSRRPGE